MLILVVNVDQIVKMVLLWRMMHHRAVVVPL